MSHFNKNLSPLLLLALFINVTTFSMNAKAILIDIHNFVSKQDWNVKIQCETPTLLPHFVQYGYKYEINITAQNITCSFKWAEGELSNHLMYNPNHDTYSTCVWILRPKPGRLCFHKSDVSENCFPYDR